MRNLDDYALECMSELDSIGIPYGRVFLFKANTRAHSFWGRCRAVQYGFEIEINVDLLDERNDVKALKNTIIHELLHTCSGCFNHGEKWRMYANKVHRLLGYDITREATAEEEGVQYYRKSNERYKYRLICPNCGERYGDYKRMCNSIKIANRGGYRCCDCKTTLIVENI